MRNELGRFVKGYCSSPLTQIKKGDLGDKSKSWKGGVINRNGYICVHSPNHPSVVGKKHKYVKQHRLVMEKEIGRYLTKEEVVHHINGIKNDNNINNLVVLTKHTHARIHAEHCNNMIGINKK